MPTKEELLEFLDIYNHPITINESQRQIYWLIYRNVDMWSLYHREFRNILEYWKFEQRFERSLKFNVQKYDPVIISDEAAKGLINCNVLNKSGEPTGKRTTMKIGRLIGLIYPYLEDHFKEKITTEIKDEHSPCDAEFNVSDTGFVRICNMSLPKATEFNTTGMQKSLKNSCMRYTANEMGLERDGEAENLDERNRTYVSVGRKNRTGGGAGPAGSLDFSLESFVLTPNSGPVEPPTPKSKPKKEVTKVKDIDDEIPF